MQKKKLFGIPGSIRSGSVNELILKEIEVLYQDFIELEIYKDLSSLPYFSPDLDKEEPPINVRDFRKKIEEADGIIFCTPEYIFSLPGALKNAIEWTVSTTIFSHKPTAFIIASALGEKAFESLNLILNTLEVKMVDDSKLLLKGARSKVDKDGKITDRETLNAIDRLVKTFL